MLTREEVLEILNYCAEHKMSQQKRLEELGITKNVFYWYKRKYQKEDECSASESKGEFIQLPTSGKFVPSAMPPVKTSGIAAARSRSAKIANEGEVLRIELRTPSGLAMCIEGKVTAALLHELVAAGNV